MWKIYAIITSKNVFRKNSIEKMKKVVYIIYMLVYRYMKLSELNYILNGEFDQVGATYDGEYSASNNHKYVKGVKYLHFFKHKDSIQYISKYHARSNCSYFIAEFDIPYSVLFLGKGRGKYEVAGIDYLTITQKEYIVPVEKMKSEYLKSYVGEKKFFLEQNIKNKANQNFERWFFNESSK